MSDDQLPIHMTPEDWTQAYEEGVPHWAESSQPSPLAKQLLEILGQTSGNHILEIGVGNGRDCIYFASEGNRVSGIDIVEKAIEMALDNVEEAGFSEKVDLHVGDAENLTYPDETFDAVYSVSVLHATNTQKSFKELSRVLKKGGKF